MTRKNIKKSSSDYLKIYRTIVLVYLVIYSLIVLGTGYGIINGTLRDGYFDLQSGFAWMLPLVLCLPSSVLSMSVIHQGLSWIMITVAVKLLGFQLDNKDLTKGIISTISMTISFILAGVIQYYLLILLANLIKFIKERIGKSKTYGSLYKKTFSVIKKEDIKKITNVLFWVLIVIAVISIAWKIISRMLIKNDIENATINNKYEFSKMIEGNFNSPSYLAIDSKDNLYISDTGNYKIQKFDKHGKFVTSWGKEGRWTSEFGKWRCAVAVDDENVYVADSENSWVQKFSNSGKYITGWGKEGTGAGEFKYVSGIAVDKTGRIFVVDYWNHRLEIFDNNGKFIEQRKTEQLDDIAIDGQNNLYVIRNELDGFIKAFKIIKFNNAGKTIRTLEVGFEHPNGICVDKENNLYVADSNNDRVFKFDSNGKVIAVIGNGQFKWPADIAVDSEGSLYISDTKNNRIQKFILKNR